MLYFIVFSDAERRSITVIDLQESVSYERNDWATVNEENFSTHLEAIAYARALAAKYGLRYELFESRYNRELNEEVALTL
ncbi:hypothetical protein ACYPKM_00595 [Pseudomonas aeruginosa]